MTTEVAGETWTPVALHPVRIAPLTRPAPFGRPAPPRERRHPRSGEVRRGPNPGRQIIDSSPAITVGNHKSWAELGEHLGTLLADAEEQSTLLRRAAARRAELLTTDARRDSEIVRMHADYDAANTLANALKQAAEILRSARRVTDTVADEATRRARTLEGQGAAIVEQVHTDFLQHANIFEAAASRRQNDADAEMEQTMTRVAFDHNEARLRVSRAQTNHDNELIDAKDRGARQISDARAEAAQLVTHARTRASQIRLISDCERSRIDEIRRALDHAIHELSRTVTALATPVHQLASSARG